MVLRLVELDVEQHLSSLSDAKLKTKCNRYKPTEPILSNYIHLIPSLAKHLCISELLIELVELKRPRLEA
jgi:hypothetical protein